MATPGVEDVLEEDLLNVLAGEHTALSEDMEDTKKALLKLQELVCSKVWPFSCYAWGTVREHRNIHGSE